MWARAVPPCSRAARPVNDRLLLGSACMQPAVPQHRSKANASSGGCEASNKALMVLHLHLVVVQQAWSTQQHVCLSSGLVEWHAAVLGSAVVVPHQVPG